MSLFLTENMLVFDKKFINNSEIFLINSEINRNNIKK